MPIHQVHCELLPSRFDGRNLGDDILYASSNTIGTTLSDFGWRKLWFSEFEFLLREQAALEPFRPRAEKLLVTLLLL